MRKLKKKILIADHCVACGACVGECPFGALSIWKGIKAKIDYGICVCCGRCAKVCPANAITSEEVSYHA